MNNFVPHNVFVNYIYALQVCITNMRSPFFVLVINVPEVEVLYCFPVLSLCFQNELV